LFKYVIWNQQWYTAWGRNWVAWSAADGVRGNHKDHIHVSWDKAKQMNQANDEVIIFDEGYVVDTDYQSPEEGGWKLALVLVFGIIGIAFFLGLLVYMIKKPSDYKSAPKLI